jgi:hypothetical protein
MVILGGWVFLMSEEPLSTKGPSWGYPRCVLGAIGASCQLLAEKCPGLPKILRKLTFEYTYEGPGVDPFQQSGVEV